MSASTPAHWLGPGNQLVHARLYLAVGTAATVFDTLDVGVGDTAHLADDVVADLCVAESGGEGGTATHGGVRVAATALEAQAHETKDRRQALRHEGHGHKDYALELSCGDVLGVLGCLSNQGNSPAIPGPEHWDSLRCFSVLHCSMNTQNP